MMITIKPDYKKVYEKVTEIIFKYNLNTIPIDLDSIIEQTDGLKLCSYSSAIAKKRCALSEWINFIGSELGAYTCDLSRMRFIIFYNDKHSNQGLDRFTIAHELGHHFLEHYAYYENNKNVLLRGIKWENYEAIEKEANCFARNLLSPVYLLDSTDINTSDINAIKNVFAISKSASIARSRLYKTDKQMVLANCIEEMTMQFQNAIGYHKNTYYCSLCEHTFSMHNSKHCPICANSNINKWKGIKRMKYKEIELNNNGQLLICLKCSNTKFAPDANFCHICGSAIINRCTANSSNDYNYAECHAPQDTHIPGNARYCPYCSYETVFYRDKLLISWEAEQEEARINFPIEVDDSLF